LVADSRGFWYDYQGTISKVVREKTRTNVKRMHFVTRREVRVERFPWGPHDWLSRPDLVDSEHLLLVRIHMPRGQGCPFHRHPHMEELVYVLRGVAEQWVGEEVRLLEAGEIAHIPRDAVHATFNAGRGLLSLLSVLGPARTSGPALVDVCDQEPWRTIHALGAGNVALKRRLLRKAREAAVFSAPASFAPELTTRRGVARQAAAKQASGRPPRRRDVKAKGRGARRRASR
jgi:quercetin dioxygenase-like cupin family protein